ncbi:pyrroloquinoline-quinone glucose dehydrogenase [Alkalilimnicola ehrlichii]|uniref:Pyrroloquinoline-quinone glucose dehydrogenase n=1 Tax=Alkalilimnicola ehrlichii TaxID=351052 RepID=A0A3E0WHT7_9GAMM|nr:PQQ-dependent sugar dehydrogenase [Alkalilimnicola ehrlichii]RFA25362.1 pyrroloquinoline-quinone glucose dehydrogenase [Alkalilimnicola ehrlichii]RFA32540.1 pyrroloquinoline-quinone glucose dehydrogenase [Alkalilimnicola ehrlichii]
MVWDRSYRGGVAIGVSFHVQAEVEVVNEVVESALESDEASFRVVRVVGGLEHPWAMAWLPDGRMLVTERPGRLQLVDGSQVTEVSGLPMIGVATEEDDPAEGEGQGGLLDIALHPDYENNGWIYFTYSSPGDDDAVLGDAEYGTGTALARGRLSQDGSELVDVEPLYVQAPRTDPGRHYGSRIVFPGDGTVMFSIGDRGLRYPSQDLTDPAGSMIRLHEDGGATEDNPFVNREPGNLRPEIYSFGHRNKQGIAIDPGSGAIWAVDHGPLGGDLLYRIEAGANYGWPQVAYGTEYSTGQFTGIGSQAPGVVEPAYWWEESMAPSGLTFYDGESFPQWRGNLFAGSLAQERLHRLTLNGDEVVDDEILLDGVVGRIRDVRQGPDGMLYVATDEADGGVYRLEPVED